MFRITIIAAMALGTGLIVAPVQTRAQDLSGPSDSARFTFYRVQENFLRLDVLSGLVSECSWRASGWFCRVVPDDRITLESVITRLVASNAALKKELLDHGLLLPAGVNPDPRPDINSVGDIKPPVVADGRVAANMGNVWRRMIGMMQNLQRDMLRKS